MFQLAYFQMVGAGKARNQDALFDGTAVRQVRLHKTRVSEADDAVRLAVADGVSSSPAAHLASRFWLDAFVREGDAEGRFLRRLHGSFCDTLADEYFGSSSTFASAVVGADGLCRICNVGDSRVYHMRPLQKALLPTTETPTQFFVYFRPQSLLILPKYPLNPPQIPNNQASEPPFRRQQAHLAC